MQRAFVTGAAQAYSGERIWDRRYERSGGHRLGHFSTGPVEFSISAETARGLSPVTETTPN